jgi:hypothetical protein
MEFIDGARLTDRTALDEMGVSRPRLAALVAEAFNEMIFIHGDVHCDPHAANLVGSSFFFGVRGDAPKSSQHWIPPRASLKSTFTADRSTLHNVRIHTVTPPSTPSWCARWAGRTSWCCWTTASTS